MIYSVSVQVLQVLTTGGVGAAIATKELKQMRERVAKAGGGRAGFSARERAARFSYKTFVGLPAAEQAQHSWTSCTLCERDVCARKMFGLAPGSIVNHCYYCASCVCGLLCVDCACASCGKCGPFETRLCTLCTP